MVAHITALLGTPTPTHSTSVRVRCYPAQRGLAVDDHAQLRRYAKEAFGSEVTIRVHCCTQLAHNNLDRPIFDFELEGVQLGMCTACRTPHHPILILQPRAP